MLNIFSKLVAAKGDSICCLKPARNEVFILLFLFLRPPKIFCLCYESEHLQSEFCACSSKLDNIAAANFTIWHQLPAIV